MENKQLQIAKDTIAKKYGYENFEAIPYNHISSVNVRYENYQDIVNEVAIEYHRLISEWVSVDERLPEIIDGKLKPILCNDGKITHKAYYFPSKSKIIEFEDLDDFDINNYPEMEEINENLYLKEGFYVKQYDKDDYEYWTEIKAEKWIPLPQPPK